MTDEPTIDGETRDEFIARMDWCDVCDGIIGFPVDLGGCYCAYLETEDDDV
jgi:hypothetical protein